MRQTKSGPYALKRLPLSKLRLDGDTQPRAELDLDVVDEYSAAYAAGICLPPGVAFFDGTDYWLADGFHRWHGANKAAMNKMEVEVRNGTVDDARWFSYSANQTHGLRRTNEDKRKAVKAALLHPNGAKMSDREIAEHVGVSQMTVNRYRNEMKTTVTELQSPTRTGRDGRTINTEKIGKAAEPAREIREKAAELFGGEPTDLQIEVVADMASKEDGPAIEAELEATDYATAPTSDLHAALVAVCEDARGEGLTKAAIYATLNNVICEVREWT